MAYDDDDNRFGSFDEDELLTGGETLDSDEDDGEAPVEEPERE